MNYDNGYYPTRENRLSTDCCYPEAIDDFTEALKLSPNNTTALLQRGLCYEKTAKYNDAIDDYSKTIQYDEQNKEAYLHRGCIYFDNKKDYKKAFVDFAKYLEFNPEDKEIKCMKKFAEILAK